jgi:site-specific recombinase XerC
VGRELVVIDKTEAVVRLDPAAVVPAVIVSAGRRAEHRFVEFFTANIRNVNTRMSYLRAVRQFFAWAGDVRLPLPAIRPVHVAAYVEQLSKEKSAPTVKQHLAAVRMLFDYLVVGQVVEMNPAAAVRGPSHSMKRGKTPVLDEDEARQLLGSIDTSTVVGLRDRAVLALMTYTFARVGALVSMNVEDYYAQGKRWWVRLHEKGGKLHEVPAHHKLEEYLDAYLDAAGLWGDKRGPLFRTALGTTKRLTANRLTRRDVYKMVKRRAGDGHRLPHVPGHRHHQLPNQRRHAGEGPTARQPRVGPDDEALRQA